MSQFDALFFGKWRLNLAMSGNGWPAQVPASPRIKTARGKLPAPFALETRSAYFGA